MKFKTLTLALLLSAAIFSTVTAQNAAINADGASPDNSAMLDVKSTSKGILIPRMTADQRINISLPATGLMVYQTDGVAGFYYNAGTPTARVWQLVGGSSTVGIPSIFTANRNYNNTIAFTSVSSSSINNSAEGAAGLITYIPVACIAKTLYVYNANANTPVTVTLRVGNSPTSLVNTTTITLAAGASGSIVSNQAIPANSFISYALTGVTSATAGALYTALTFADN